MHILTKLLVVVAAVLGVLLSGLSITLTTNADRLQRELGAAQARASEAEAFAEQAVAQSAAEKSEQADEMRALQSRIDELTSTLNVVEGQRDELRTRTKALELGEATYQARIDDFTARIDALIRVNEAASAEAGELRQRVRVMEQREIELSDRISDLENQNQVASETVRGLREQVVELERELAGGGTSLAGGAEAETTLRAPREFRARVVSTGRDASGTTLVSIDAGSNDLLSEGMKLNVVDGRSASFLGSIVITRVDLNESVGRLVLDRGRITEGDLVLPADL